MGGIALGIANTIITGIISGVIASMCFSGFLLLIKPRVKISDQIALENTGRDEKVYRIKVVNKTFAMLTNLRYSLHYCVGHGDGIYSITEIPPRKTPILSITSYSLKPDNTDYAVRLSYDIDAEKYPLDGDAKLIFTFIADHAVSNTTKCIRKEYVCDNIIDGVFESDKSTKIIRKHFS